MKTFFALLVFVAAQCAFAGMVVESVPTTVDVLRAKGVQVSKTPHGGSVSSVTVDDDVAQLQNDETFKAQELVIYDAEFSGESLREIDAYGSERVLRRERTVERKAKFEVFGKEADRAYLAFEFEESDKSSMPHYRRYLILLSAIDALKG